MSHPVNQELENRYSYHAPKEGQADRYERVRNGCKALAYLITEVCPDSRDRSRALSSLDDVMYQANASIARNE